MITVMMTVGCSDVDRRKDSGTDETGDTASLVACAPGPFASVEVGYAGLCATHQDGCVECVALDKEGVEDYGLDSPPTRELTGVRLSDGCDSSSEESSCSPQFGACGIRADDQVACWGANFKGPADAAPGVSALAVSVGYRHACAADLTGVVNCWGSCLNESCDAPDGEFTAVASGHDFSCALAFDGSAECWGYDSAAFGGSIDPWSANLAAWSAGPFVELLAVPGGPCGRDRSNSVICFSFDGGESIDPIVVVAAATSWTAMQSPADGVEAVCALTATGALTCEGTVTSIPVEKLSGYAFTSIASSYDRLCGVTPEGEIVCAVINENWAYCDFCTELFP